MTAFGINILLSMRIVSLLPLAVATSLSFAAPLRAVPAAEGLVPPAARSAVALPQGHFTSAAYTPAVLTLSFTDPDAAEIRPGMDAFLDITLVLDGEDPLGRRVSLKRDDFVGLLRDLYRQLARQEPLQVASASSPSRQLHRLLIEPVADQLQKKRVSTLLIAADRGLQAVPIAALHDGEAFFGERFGFSLTPSLTLTSLAPPASGRNSSLTAGASQFTGLAPLPLVPQEVAAVASGGMSESFLNASFTPQVLLERAGDPRFDRVHVATHADFQPGGPEKARLYTGTGALSMAEFQNLRQRREDNPLELFVLSACRTALGDGDSELGFAGLALQAGSRSAVGTLWYVDDVATSAFFLQFYRHLDGGLPKAEAMQATRLDFTTDRVRLEGDRLIGSDGTPLLVELDGAQRRRVERGLRHPYYWAGMALLGTPW